MSNPIRSALIAALVLFVAQAAAAGVPTVKDKEKPKEIVRMTGSSAGAAQDWFTVPAGFVLILTDIHVVASEEDTAFSVFDGAFAEVPVDVRVSPFTTHTASFNIGPVFPAGSAMQVQATTTGGTIVRWHVAGYLAKAPKN